MIFGQDYKDYRNCFIEELAEKIDALTSIKKIIHFATRDDSLSFIFPNIVKDGIMRKSSLSGKIVYDVVQDKFVSKVSTFNELADILNQIGSDFNIHIESTSRLTRNLIVTNVRDWIIDEDYEVDITCLKKTFEYDRNNNFEVLTYYTSWKLQPVDLTSFL